MRTLLLTLITCLFVLPTQAKYGGGMGEPNDPYQIATAADLIALGETPADYDKHFILTADIDLDPNLPGRKVFDRAVIAPDIDPDDRWGEFQGTSFGGILDGNGRTISHLTITGKDYLGLFGRLGPFWLGEVRNLGILDANITGSGGYIGGVVGCNAQGTLIQCYSTGSVSVSGADRGVGGLVGYNGCYDWRGGTVTNCYSTCAVSGTDNVGGLVGINWEGAVNDCSSSGAVSGESCVGGVLGSNWEGTVIQSYSTGAVSGTDCIGGLVGNNPADRTGCGEVTRCYSTGAVSGNSEVGGLVGYNEGPVTNSFWDTQTSGQTTSAAGTGKTTAEMQTASTFLDAGWDFVDETANGTEDIWKIAEGLDYPRLWWEPYDGRVTVVLGQIFTVTLESNPSTGYRWEWVDNQDSILEQIGEAQFKPRETGDPALVGAGGWESFDFKAVKQGQMTLKVIYRRPWEEGVEPLKTFSLQVTVP